MKRHIALQPLSREHHEALLLSQLLRNDVPDYAGMPSTTEGKVVYAKKIFQETLLDHFKKEEIIFRQSKGLQHELDNYIEELLAEHKTLSQSFQELDPASTSSEQLHELGQLLNLHIRKEERIVFPLLEQYCPAPLLEQFSLLL